MTRRLIDIQRDLILARDSYESLDENTYLEEVDNLTKELYDKEDGVYSYYKHLMAEVQKAKETKDKISNYMRIQKNAAERLKKYVIHTYQELGELPYYSDFQPIKISTSSGSVEITDINILPDEYYRKKIVIEPDKKKILADLKSGTKIPGAKLIKNSYVRGLK